MVSWPEEPFQRRFHIFAHGGKFDVDDFLVKSTLRPDFQWRREPPLTSGIEFLLGNGRALSLREQETAALTYLQTKREELRAVAAFPGVEIFILGLVYIAKLGDGATGVALDWDRDLMIAALMSELLPFTTSTMKFRPNQITSLM